MVGEPVIAAWAVLVLLGVQEPSNFDRAMSLVTEGRFAQALTAAEGVESAAERERARLHVLWSAGDLGGAFRAAHSGLQQEPQDPWLLERATALAISLGAAESAAQHLDALRASLNELPQERRANYLSSVEAHQIEVTGMLERLEARRRGATRARMVVLVGVFLAVGVWIHGATGRASTAAR